MPKLRSEYCELDKLRAGEVLGNRRECYSRKGTDSEGVATVDEVYTAEGVEGAVKGDTVLLSQWELGLKWFCLLFVAWIFQHFTTEI